MMDIGRPNEIGIARLNLFHEIPEVDRHLVGVLLRAQSGFSCFDSYLIAVLISTNLEAYLFPVLFLISCPDVCQKIIKSMADMRRTVDVRNSSSYIKIF